MPTIKPRPAEPEPEPDYNRDAIFEENGPINPLFMTEAVRTLFRALPIDPDEPKSWANRRMATTLQALAAQHPRDEIEVMLGVQSLCAFHAAALCWHLGMNHHSPRGSGLRHFSAAASSARTFDTLLKALERRQAKPLSVPRGRPANRTWPDEKPEQTVGTWQDRCTGTEREPDPVLEWTQEAITETEARLEHARIEAENESLDIANTEGILPGGGMIVPENSTPQQTAYLARRFGLSLKREYWENRKNGIDAYPKIRPTRPGDLIS
jgi:hypothetical protein